MRKMDAKLYQLRADILKALAHPIRLAIVEFLKEGEQCVCEIARIETCDRTNISKHLSILAGAGILSSRKQGLKVYYSLKCPCILEFMHCIENVIRTDLKEKERLLSRL